MVEEYRLRLDLLTAKHKSICDRLEYEQQAKQRADLALQQAQQAQQLLQSIAAAVQQETHSRIASIVSRCLEAVFDEPYEFHIDFEQKRGKTEAVLTFQRGGIAVDPMTASGGGVVDVAAFALRLSCLLLTRPKLRKVLILDEPFRFVSKEYRPRVRQLMERLAEEMEIQFIVVTHIHDFRTGNVVEIV